MGSWKIPGCQLQQKACEGRKSTSERRSEMECMSTGDVCSQLPIAEPPGGLMVLKVPPVGREVRLEDGLEVVIVAHIDSGVAEGYNGRHERGGRLRIPADGSQEEEDQSQQGPHSAVATLCHICSFHGTKLPDLITRSTSSLSR